MREFFPKVYRSFEEFEREELRRADSFHLSVDDLIDDMFAEELDLDAGRGRRRRDEEAEDEEA